MYYFYLHFMLSVEYWERSGSKVEYFTQDQGVWDWSLTCITVLCQIEQDTLILTLYWFNPGKPVPTKMKN